MKKRLMTIFMALTVLCTALAVQVMPVSAEETDADLRVWFNFDKDENYFLERNNQFFDLVSAPESLGVSGVFGNDVEVVKGLNGDALKFAGTVANIDTIATVSCTSAFYIKSDVDFFAGDNVTINIVYKEDTTEQIQSILYAGLSPAEFMAVHSSFSTKSVGAQLAINDSGAFDEQKFSAPTSTIPTAGTWNMLTIVQEGTTYNIYVNGELVATENMTWKMGDINSKSGSQYLYALGAPSPYNDLSEWLVGAPSDAPGFKGLVDDFRVYGAALTEDEIKALALELNVIASPVDAYAENMFGLVVRDSYDDVGGVAVPDDPGANTDGIGNVHNNAWVSVPKVTFGDEGAKSITLRYCAKASRMGANGKVAIWMDGKSTAENGTLIGEVALPITGPEYTDFDIVSANLLNTVTGTHDVYFVFTADTTESNPYVANMSYFQFGVASVDTEEGGETGDGEEGDGGDNIQEELVSNTVIDWDFSDADSFAGVTLGNGVTVESGKATFAPGNEGIALPDDVFADAETITIEMTMQPSAFANYRALLCGGNQNGKWFVMGVMADGSVRYAVATNGDDASEAKGNSVSGEGGATAGVVGSDIVLTTDREYAVKYVITQGETKVYVDGELALTVPTPDKDAIGTIGGPVVLGKATKWPDSSYEGTISTFKVTVEKMEAVEGGDDNGNDSGNQGGAGDDATNKPSTGDVAMLTSILAAGVAALGGLKLRKRSK